MADGNEFYVFPTFEEERVSNYLINGSEEKLGTDMIYLSYGIASDISDNPESLIGKSIEIQCFVPTKLYVSEATKPKRDSERYKEEERVEIDGCVSKLVKINKKIGGIINNSYKNDKSDNNGKII